MFDSLRGHQKSKNMIVCVCRNISDQQYSTKEELVERLQEKDRQCSACMSYVKELKKNALVVELVDTPVLEAGAEMRESSSLS